MLNAAAISLSGMNAAQTTMDVSAHNIANLGTRDFLRQQVVQLFHAQSDEWSGLEASLYGVTAPRAAPPLRSDDS